MWPGSSGPVYNEVVPPRSVVRSCIATLIAVILAGVLPAAGQARPPGAGTIEGVVTTQGGTIHLAGARIVVHDAGSQEIASALSEGDGHFRITALPEGSYTVTVTLEGFASSKSPAVVRAQKPSTLSLDLAIATMAQTIEVVAPMAIVSSADTLSATESIGSRETEQLTGGSGLDGTLRLLASVIEVPGGLSIKGGRPTQAGLQMGASTLTDPALGLVHLTLPEDAIDSVAVMPNPYAVEFGRFSSGLVVIQTRRAGSQWRMRLNNLAPTFRAKRHKDLYTITGISGFGPNLSVGGPIIKDRVFVEQTAQYRYSTDDIASRPEDERRTTHWLSSFTRVDANLTPRHSVTGTAAIFPSVTTMASLGTFTPPDATVDVRERVNHATIGERALWTDTLVSESTVQVRGYRAEVSPQGSRAMELRPDTTFGNFYNHQTRTPTTVQAIQTVSGSAQGRTGLHLFKFGVDLLSNTYEGQSESRPLMIERPDGTLVRRLDFAGASRQRRQSTDVAFFAQDRVQPGRRWYAEYGARLDRDGIVERWNLTPRVGAALLLNDAGSAVLRGGFGLFFERTPSAAGVLDQFERFTDTRFVPDASGSAGVAVPFRFLTASDLRTARSRTWDIGYEYRWRPWLSVRASLLDRRGSRELILDSTRTPQSGAILLQSGGRSRYRDFEVGAHLSHTTRFDLNASYARAMAEGDLNTFGNFFDTKMWPVVAPNQYGPLPADVPHRMLARGRWLPTPTWLVVAIADWRTGLPYSIVNETLDFVGPRNTERMPNFFRLDLGLEHRFDFGKLQPWIGVRAYNALNSFLPADVQANIASPAFGSLYNSQFRQFRIQVRFER